MTCAGGPEISRGLFTYEDSWLEATEVHRSLSLSIRLQNKEHRGESVRNFFVNLLPDNPNVVAAIANRLELRSTDVFDVLRAVGGDCVGALELLPKQRSLSFAERYSYCVLSDSEIEELLGQLNALPLGMSEREDFRLSIAGAQQKTALTKLPGVGWVLPSGTLPTTHIFKTPIGSLLANSIHFDESCENEWLCLEIARAFGLSAANAEILTFGCRKAIVVARFDRAISRRQNNHILRIPTEDFCQVMGLPPEKKYEADGARASRTSWTFSNGVRMLTVTDGGLWRRRCFFGYLIQPMATPRITRFSWKRKISSD